VNQALTKLGYAIAATYAVVIAVCLAKMSGNAASFFDPVGLLFLVWALSPVAVVAWFQGDHKPWWAALVPLTAFGTLAFYDMAFRPGSSTAALGVIFIPIYQWAFAIFVAGALFVIDGLKKRSGASN
jgi:hypothetical protein